MISRIIEAHATVIEAEISPTPNIDVPPPEDPINVFLVQSARRGLSGTPRSASTASPIDFDVMDALHEKGYITDPKGRRESVHLSKQGMELPKRLAGEVYGLTDHHDPNQGDFG